MTATQLYNKCVLCQPLPSTTGGERLMYSGRPFGRLCVVRPSINTYDNSSLSGRISVNLATDRSIEQGLASHRTHYRSYRGR